MRVIVKRVGQSATVFDGAVDYDFMVRSVGGTIEMVSIGPGVDVVCNEEGMHAGPDGTPLPQNAAGFLGDILIVGIGDEGDGRDLTDEEVRKALAYLERFADVPHPGDAGAKFFVGTESQHVARSIACDREQTWAAL